MKRIHLFLCIVFVFLILSGAKLGKKQKLTVATSPHYPPMEMIDSEKRIIGFDIDVISKIAEHQKMNIKLLPVLKENLLRGLIDESYDIAISSITIREAEVYPESMDISFSEPYLEIGDVIVLSEDFEEYTGPESLKGLEVGILRGSTSQRILSEDFGIKVKQYSNIEAAFEDMASGKIHAISINLPLASRMVNFNDEYRGIFKIVPEPITKERYVIAVKKGNTQLLFSINEGIQALKKSDNLDSLIDKWFFAK